jgi:hypothetical protein
VNNSEVPCGAHIDDKPFVRVGDRSWAFDGVFGIDSKQKDVFDDTVSPLVRSCLDGYNATVLACNFLIIYEI